MKQTPSQRESPLPKHADAVPSLAYVLRKDGAVPVAVRSGPFARKMAALFEQAILSSAFAPAVVECGRARNTHSTPRRSARRSSSHHTTAQSDRERAKTNQNQGIRALIQNSRSARALCSALCPNTSTSARSPRHRRSGLLRGGWKNRVAKSA